VPWTRRKPKTILACGGSHACALVLFNTVLAFAGINLLLWATFGGWDAGKGLLRSRSQRTLFQPDGSPVDNGKRSEYQLKWFDYGAYEEVPAEYAAEVLDDFFALASRGFVYQPWVQFAEPPHIGKRVSVRLDQCGFPMRGTVNPVPDKPARPLLRVFTFGGSTTFGYNVSDEHTWPSWLSKLLNERAREDGLDVQVEVSNYGRGYYDSSQELVLLIDLLKHGHRPSLVIFMDGVNEGNLRDAPFFTERVEAAFEKAQFPDKGSHLLRALRLKDPPIDRLAAVLERWGGRVASRLRPSKEEDKPAATEDLIEEQVSQSVRRMTLNRRLAAACCRSLRVEPLFILQPNPGFNYPTNLYRLPLPAAAFEARGRDYRFYEQSRPQDGIIDLSDLFQAWGADRKAIVDDCHYSPNFNRFVAAAVASHIDLGALQPSPPRIDPALRTAARRESGAKVEERTGP
jgi:lysophospholipase L1-like esterase